MRRHKSRSIRIRRPRSTWERLGGAGRAIRSIPVVRGPDVTGWIDRYIRQHLDAAACEDVQDIAGFRARRMPFRIVPAISTTPRPLKLRIHTSSLPSMFNPQGISIAPLPVRPAGTGWLPSGRIMLITPVGFG